MRTCRNGTEPGSPAAARRHDGGGDQRQQRERRPARRGSTTWHFLPAFTALVRSRSSADPARVVRIRRDDGCGCASASGRRRRGEVRGSGGKDGGPVRVQLVDQLPGHLGEPAFVGVGQPRRQLLQRHPGHLADFDVLVGELAAEKAHQIVVHRLVHATALGDEPVVDAAERGQHTALDAGLLGDLPDRGLLGGFTELDVALGQRPQHPAAPVDAPDQRRHLTVLGPVEAVDHQPARRGFVHGAQAIRRRAAGRDFLGLGWPPGCSFFGRHGRVVVVLAVLASGGPAARRPRRRPRRRRGLACSPSDTQAIVAATKIRSRRTHRS